MERPSAAEDYRSDTTAVEDDAAVGSSAPASLYTEDDDDLA